MSDDITELHNQARTAIATLLARAEEADTARADYKLARAHYLEKVRDYHRSRTHVDAIRTRIDQHHATLNARLREDARVTDNGEPVGEHPPDDPMLALFDGDDDASIAYRVAASSIVAVTPAGESRTSLLSDLLFARDAARASNAKDPK
jgi:hypothetical protein